MEWLNFRHLYAFWSVCRYGGFQKASEKIHVSQSAISDQVAQLEDYLEQQLLERTTRSLQITPVGHELLSQADEIFSKSSEINQVFKGKSDASLSFPLRVGIVGGVSRNLIYRTLLQNLIEGEQPNISVIDGSFEELSQMLKSYELDLIFSLEVPRKKNLSRFSFKKIATSPMVLAGKPHVVSELRKRKKTELDMNLFLFSHQFEGDIVFEKIQPKFNLNAKVPITSDDISLLRFLAHSGRGVAVIPEIGVQEDLDQGLLSRVSLDGIPAVDFYATFLTNSFHINQIKHFLG